MLSPVKRSLLHTNNDRIYYTTRTTAVLDPIKTIMKRNKVNLKSSAKVPVMQSRERCSLNSRVTRIIGKGGGNEDMHTSRISINAKSRLQH
jgi:hypothetical protein